jgi:HAE1 family hydrophobic/amphiphilic exporter-1
VKIRGKELKLAEVGLQLQLIDVIARVEQNYWDLVAARQDVGVKQESVALAQQQLETNRRFVQAGTLAQVELSASEAELERRRDDLFTSITNLTAAENRLKNLLAPNLAHDLWKDQIVPTETSRPSSVPQIVDLQEYVSQALSNRLELKQLATQGKIVEAQKDLAADQKRPQVDLVAGYANTGLAGTVRSGTNPLTASNAALYEQVNRLSAQAGLPPLAPPSFGALPQDLIGSNGTSWSNLFSGRYQTFEVGVNIDLNLRNRTAEANYSQAQLAQRRVALERTRAQQTIGQQVRDSLQAIESARQRVTAAEAGARAAREKLESETRLFQSGESTNFLVLTRQNEYANSRLRAIVANVDLNRALARLEVATGNTLSTYGLD